jgi:hypothetical protein
MKIDKKGGFVWDILFLLFIILIGGTLYSAKVHYDETGDYSLKGCKYFKPQFNMSNEYGYGKSCYTTYWKDYCKIRAIEDCPNYNENVSEYNRFMEVSKND